MRTMKLAGAKGFLGCALLVVGLNLQATITTYSIQDIGSFTGYTTPNTGQTYAGTGFVGLYDSGLFAHLFGLEQANYSRTALQVDISGLAGSVINSAYLQFTLLNGANASQTVTATSYSANGNLGYLWNAPDNLGASTYTVLGLSGNSLDVTGLLQARVSANANWFGLHLAGSSQYQWTYTYPGFGYNPDSAAVRLVVDSTPVPEPSTYIAGALMLLPFGATVIRSVRRKSKA